MRLFIYAAPTEGGGYLPSTAGIGSPCWLSRALVSTQRAMFIVGGLVSVAFGVVLFARPNVGAVTLAPLISGGERC